MLKEDIYVNLTYPPPGSQESEHLIQNGAAPILNLSDVFLDVHYWYYFGYIIFDLEQEVASFAQEVWSPDNQIPEKSLQKFWGLQSSSVLNSVPWSCLKSIDVRYNVEQHIKHPAKKKRSYRKW